MRMLPPTMLMRTPQVFSDATSTIRLSASRSFLLLTTMRFLVIFGNHLLIRREGRFRQPHRQHGRAGAHEKVLVLRGNFDASAAAFERPPNFHQTATRNHHARHQLRCPRQRTFALRQAMTVRRYHPRKRLLALAFALEQHAVQVAARPSAEIEKNVLAMRSRRTAPSTL